MADCIFCRIVEGEVPCFKVHENSEAIAFLDINPLTRGHTLVVPKHHLHRLEEMAAKDAAGLFQIVHEVTQKLQKSLAAPATTIAINNGPEAGQEVPHVHVHVIPRREYDGAGPIHAMGWPRPQTDKAELAKIAEKVKRATAG